jgi:hypothetical protein
MAVRPEVFGLAAGHPDPQVRRHVYKLADAVEDYIMYNTSVPQVHDPRHDFELQSRRRYERVENLWNLIRTETQIEDIPGTPEPYSVEGEEITEETQRERQLEAEAKNLKVGDTALLLRSGLKVTLFGIYRVEEPPRSRSTPLALEEGEVCLVAHVAVENLERHYFEVGPGRTFQLTGTQYRPSKSFISSGEHYPSGKLETDWLQEVAGEAGTRLWKGKIKRGEQREGYLAYRMQDAGEALLWFRTVGDLEPTALYGAKAHRSVAVWHLREVARLPTLPEEIRGQWIRERKERMERLGIAVRAASKRPDEGSNLEQRPKPSEEKSFDDDQ